MGHKSNKINKGATEFQLEPIFTVCIGFITSSSLNAAFVYAANSPESSVEERLQVINPTNKMDK